MNSRVGSVEDVLVWVIPAAGKNISKVYKDLNTIEGYF